MCKFHKDVAREIATNPITNKFEPGIFAIGLLAMASFRIEQHMPEMFGCDGFIPSQMTTDTAVKSFEKSGLSTDIPAMEQYFSDNIDFVRNAMRRVTQNKDISLDAMNISDLLVKDGYKATQESTPDMTQAGPFMDEAVVQLFDGYEDAEKTYASGPLKLLTKAHKPEFETLRTITDEFLKQPGVRDVLNKMFENALSTIFINAKNDVELGLGMTKTNGCVMCGHGSRAASNEKKLDKSELSTPPASKPQKGDLVSSFKAAASGIAGAAISHIGCMITPTVGAAFGLAVSGPFMSGLTLVASPLIAMGATLGFDKVSKKPTTIFKLATSAVIALGIAGGIMAFTDNDHSDHIKPSNNNEHEQQQEENDHMNHHHHSSLRYEDFKI
jgi:hypothetical protein